MNQIWNVGFLIDLELKAKGDQIVDKTQSYCHLQIIHKQECPEQLTWCPKEI